MALQQLRWLADDFYLVAHDDISGRPQPAQAVGLGLGAALLGELMLGGCVTVRDDLVVVVSRQPPVDALSHMVLDQLTGERQFHGVPSWLAYLGRQAAERVAGRLERNGLVRREESRRLLRAEVRWRPVDMSVAAWPGSRLKLLLEREQSVEYADAVLLGLVEATGLTPVVLWGLGPRAMKYRDYLLAALPGPLRELVAHTQAPPGGHEPLRPFQSTSGRRPSVRGVDGRRNA